MTKAAGPWRVGEVAGRTGLTVRTLHHYDAIGLVSPSRRGGAGRRLYGADDLDRLQRVLALKALGLSLGEIRGCLERPGSSPLEVIGRLLDRTNERIGELRALAKRLEWVAAAMGRSDAVSADDLFETIEALNMFGKYFTPEQAKKIEERGREAGAEAIRAIEAEWPALIAKVRAMMEGGIDPKSPEVRPLAERWIALVREFTGGDPGIAESLREMYRHEYDNLKAQHGDGIPDAAVSEYIGKAMKGLEGDLNP